MSQLPSFLPDDELRTTRMNMQEALRRYVRQWLFAVTRDISPSLLIGSQAQAFIECAAEAAIELGLPLTPSTIYQLLLDRHYFEERLPAPLGSPVWGDNTGTESVIVWWTKMPDQERDLARPYLEKLASLSEPRIFLFIATENGIPLSKSVNLRE